MSQNTNRRRSLSMTSESTFSAFLSRFKQPMPTPSKSVQSFKPQPTMSTTRKKYEAVLGVSAEEILAEKKNVKFGSLFRKKHSKSVVDFIVEESESISIYSTFGPESTKVEEIEEESEEEDDAQLDKLSKRLSGGHYGSAGGLLLSIEQRPTRPTRALPPHPKECATRLWHEDESFVQREQIAEWLGKSKNKDTLHEYMLFFDFTKLRLDNAFRKVCSKLYFRAEAQQMDRILEAFANRYWQCNPRSIFSSADIIYAVVYSLLLLNTDLHVAQGTYARMTRQEFVKNTMSTVRDQKQDTDEHWETHIEAYLKDMYISVKNNQILQPMQDYDSSSISSSSTNKRMSVMAGKRMIRSLNTMIHKSASTRESMLFLDDSSLARKSSSSSNWPITPRESFTSPSNNAFAREGIVMRKHLLESKNQKARHREWRECLLVVRQGEFKMYGLPYENYGEKKVEQYNDYKWAAYTQLIGSVDLQHTLSNALPPPGYNRSRPFVFALQEPNGGVYLIQTTSQDQINEWVETCNYWAARKSKEPLQGVIGNIEYGWGDCLNDVILDLDSVDHGDYIHDPDAVNISLWTPPAPSMVPSALDEKTQLLNMQKYVEQLNLEINEHREIKRKILVKFQYKSPNQSKALANWEAKSTYMLHEIIKYQNYCNALEKYNNS